MEKPNNIKKYREGKNLTVRELAKVLELHLGKTVDPSTVTRHETRSRPVSHSYVLAYARAFKVETYQLFN